MMSLGEVDETVAKTAVTGEEAGEFFFTHNLDEKGGSYILVLQQFE